MGQLISFEGGDGAGKTTQIARLANWLDGLGVPVIRTREPGGTDEAEAIRTLLVAQKADWDPLAEAMLHYAARREHVEKRIRPALTSGTWVLCDRFYDSTIAYQCYGQGVALEDESALRQFAIGALRPDLTLLLDIPVAAGRDRTRDRRQSRYEEMNNDLHLRVREGFLAIAHREPERVTIIDAAEDPESVAAAVRAVVARRFDLS
ncbi:MAG: dTMP kinase [Alphaproteobacteria bacterium]|nr:dTMP kinase [Alphaproteobacteria bacterium]MCY4230522.1 dTMP kinase [Alphaproteobacteria bacterium]MCY4317656.1 dTMP kinase [Alphaproteobacteria bacterium]